MVTYRGTFSRFRLSVSKGKYFATFLGLGRARTGVILILNNEYIWKFHSFVDN